MEVNLNHQTSDKRYYLQTSPEFAMKRLLAMGSGSIYQITKAFRDEEKGRYHNPEFTMLEWYRTDFTYLELMSEVEALLKQILNPSGVQIWTYFDLFQEFLGINPHQTSVAECERLRQSHEIAIDAKQLGNNLDHWLQLLLTHVIEPKLPTDQLCFIVDYPASQAALAEVVQKQELVAERFECYFNGMELANGFQELRNPDEQYLRFCQDIQQRQDNRQVQPPIDYRLLAALEQLPVCSGVAMGLDRLLLCRLNGDSLEDVLSFTIERC